MTKFTDPIIPIRRCKFCGLEVEEQMIEAHEEKCSPKREECPSCDGVGDFRGTPCPECHGAQA